MERITVQVESDHVEFAEDMVEQGEAKNRSKLTRDAYDTLMYENGYRNGKHRDTTLRGTVREFARLFIYGGFAWLAVSVLWATHIRLGGVFLLLMGLIMIGIDQLLAKVEPRVTDRLNGILSRGETA